MDDPYGNEGLRFPALQNALNGYPIQHQPQQHLFAQHHQMVQPGNGHQHQQAGPPLRNLVPRNDVTHHVNGGHYRIIPMSGPVVGQSMRIGVLPDGTQIAYNMAAGYATAPDGSRIPIQQIQPGRYVDAQGNIREAPYQTVQRQGMVRMPQQVILQQQMQQQRQHQMQQRQLLFQQQQRQQQQQLSTQFVAMARPQENELITISPTPSPPPTQEEEEEVEEPMDMPVLDRQDAESRGSDTDSTDETTEVNRSLFLREAEEFERANGGKMVEHLTDGGVIMESNRPFQTKFFESDDFNEVLAEVKRRVKILNAPRGRRGRPRKIRQEDVVEPERKKKGTAAAADKRQDDGVKRRRKKTGEAQRLLQMDFGPKSGEIIIPEKRRRSGNTSVQKEESSPPVRRRATRRSRQESDFQEIKNSTEESEIEDELTEASDYEPAMKREVKESKEKKATHCMKCGEFIVKYSYRRPQWCSNECRAVTLTPKKGSEEDTSRDRSPAESLDTIEAMPTEVKLEVVHPAEMCIPTTGQKLSRKGKEGEGAAVASGLQVPTRSRLKAPASAYKLTEWPGCSSVKVETRNEKSSTPSTVKEEQVESSVSSRHQSISKMKRPAESAQSPNTSGHLVQTPQLKVRRSNQSPAPVQSSPQVAVKEELPQTIILTPRVPPNPESWTREQTRLYTSAIDPALGEICVKYKLDGYVLLHGAERLEAVRKNHFKLDVGRPVPFGPWKKLMNAMREFAVDIRYQKIPMVDFDDCPEDYRHIRNWATGITDDETGRLLEKFQLGEIPLRSCTIEELVSFVGLSYGAAFKILLVAENNPKNKSDLVTDETVEQSFDWSCVTRTIKTGERWPNFEFKSWIEKSFGQKISENLLKNYICMDTLYDISTEEWVNIVGLTFSEAKLIQSYARALMGLGGKPPNALMDVYGVNAKNFLEGTLEERLVKLKNWLTKFIEDDMCALIYEKGIDSQLIFLLSAKELHHDVGVDFSAAKKIYEKLQVVKNDKAYPDDESPELPDNFVENWKTMKFQDVANFVKEFCVKDDEKKLLANKIDGSCLPYLNMEILQQLGLKYGSAKNLFMRLQKAKVFADAKILPSNFGKMEGEELEEWIVYITDKETWEKMKAKLGKVGEKMKSSQMKARYFKFFSLEDFIEMGISYGNGLKILASAKRAGGMMNQEVTIPPGKPTEWSVEDVYQWVSSITDAEVADQIRQNSLDGSTIGVISQEEYLTEIEIPFATYKVIMAQFEALTPKTQ